MTGKTKILILEDNAIDIALLRYELEKGAMNYESKVVQNEPAFREALREFIPDIILSDYSLPSFDGHAAFRIKEETAPDIPFIIVSGIVGEEKAVELIKNGVTDYVLKDKLFTLPPKISRALKEAEEKKEKTITDEKLHKAKNLYAFISQVNQNIVLVKDEATLFRNSCRLAIEFGRFKMAWIGLFDFENRKIFLVEQSGVPAEDLELFAEASYQPKGPQDHVLRTGKHFICNDFQNGPGLMNWKPFGGNRGINSCMVLPIRKSGSIIGTFNLYSTELNFSGEDETRLLVEVTDNISFALDLFEKAKLYRQATELVANTEKKFRHTLDNLLEGIQIHDYNWRYLYVNDVLVKSGTYSREEMIGCTLMEKYPGIEQSDLFKSLQQCMDKRVPVHLETKFVFPGGKTTDFELSIEPIPEGISILSIDRTEQNKARVKLLKVNRLYAFISAINQSIVHIKNEQELLNKACKIAVDIGQFKMAWISAIDEQSGKLNTVSLSGSKAAVKSVQKVSGMNYRDAALSGTPTGRVLSTGQPAVSNDLQNDPSISEWKKEITEIGLKAGMSLPIKKFGRLVGIFGFYSTIENVFDEEEIALLEEATGDISFALENFEKAKQHSITEELIIKNEKRFRTIVEQGTDAVAIFSPAGHIQYISPSVEKILGYTEEETMQLGLFSLVYPGDEAELSKTWEQMLVSPGIPIPGYTGRLLHKNGTWRWVEATVTNMLHDPLINGVVDNFRDVTEKVVLEEQRDFDKKNLDALINNTKDLMWSVDRDFKLITSNEPFDKITSLAGRRIGKGSSVLSGAFSAEQSLRFKLFYERAFAGETFTEFEHSTVPTEYWLEISFCPIRKGDEVIGSACYSRDITEKKKSEQQLTSSEAFNRGVLNSLSSHIAVVDTSGRIVAVNESWKRFAVENGATALIGLGEGANYYKVCKESAEKGNKDASDVFQGIRDVMNGKRATFYLEYSCHSPNEKRWFGMRILKFDSNEPMVVIAHQNITERKLAEENLIQSEARLNEAQGIAHLGNWELNFETQQALWSDEACKIYGLSPAEKTQTYSAWKSFIHPGDLDAVMAATDKARETLCDNVLNHRILLKNGKVKHIYVKSKFKFNPQGKPVGLYGIILDVTDRKSADEEREKMIHNIVQHSKNLEQFTSIVSHNLRAPVANILGLSNILKNKISKEDRLRSQQFLFKATEQLDDVIKDMVKILQARSEINEYTEQVSFTELVDTIKSSIRNVIEQETVQIITDFGATDKITSIKSYMHSVFYNLISNSIKYRQPGKKPIIKIKSGVSKEKISISFKDNGVGIDLTQHGDKIFGLYNRFHLNTEGKGLGLFMVKTQVEVLGGSIRIKSKPGKGAEFIIELPL